MNTAGPQNEHQAGGTLITGSLLFLLLFLFAPLCLPQEGPALRKQSGTLKLRLMGATGPPAKGSRLQVGRSPLASFPRLLPLINPTPSLRDMGLRIGRARVSLPTGVAVAISLSGDLSLAWTGPFFPGQSADLKVTPPGKITVHLPDLPAGTKVLLELATPPLFGAGILHRRNLIAHGPGPFVLPPFPTGKSTLTVITSGLAPVGRQIQVSPGDNPTITIKPQRGGILLGRITGLTMNPAHQQGQISLDGKVIPWAGVKPDGTFRLAGIPCDGRIHRVAVQFPATIPRSYWWKPDRPGVKKEATFKFAPPIPLQAILRNPSGSPAVGREVVVTGGWNSALKLESWALSAITDTKGRLRVYLPATGLPAAIIILGGAGPQGMLMTPTLKGSKPIDLGPLPISQGTDLQGRILGLTRDEAKKTRVELLPPTGGPFFLETLCRAVPVAPDGSFSFLGCGYGYYLLRVHAPHRVGLEKEICLGGASNFQKITPRRGVEVRGSITFPGGKPAPGAEVTFKPLAKDALPVIIISDQQGGFVAPGVPMGPCRVSASLEKDGINWSARVRYGGDPTQPVKLELFREP